MAAPLGAERTGTRLPVAESKHRSIPCDPQHAYGATARMGPEQGAVGIGANDRGKRTAGI